MIYVQRDSDGVIIGIYSTFQEGYAEELLSEDSEEVVDFFRRLENDNAGA